MVDRKFGLLDALDGQRLSAYAMQSLSLSFRRAYATSPKHPGAVVAQAASTPLDVRYRRAQLVPKPTDPHRPNENARIAAKERLQNARVRIAETSERRGRIRGTRRVIGVEGKPIEKVVGQRIYLPNILFRMMRNQTQPGKAYNPFEATFRVPQSVTKTDVRSYLHTVYGVECTYIRTDNYLPPLTRFASRQRAKYTAYKRAIVGLVKPFYYPLAVEDMDGKERFLRETALEETFKVKALRLLQKEIRIRITQRTADKWSLRDDQWEPRTKILKNILRRKEEREQRTRLAADAITKMREEGKGALFPLTP